jgi:hypothetical protein
MAAGEGHFHLPTATQLSDYYFVFKEALLTKWTQPQMRAWKISSRIVYIESYASTTTKFI